MLSLRRAKQKKSPNAPSRQGATEVAGAWGFIFPYERSLDHAMVFFAFLFHPIIYHCQGRMNGIFDNFGSV